MKQTTFKFYVDKYNPQEFIVSNANKLAFDKVQSWPETQWGVLPYPKALILQAPVSAGKTFLARIWASKNNATFIKPQDQFDINRLDSNDCFVIEDIDKWSNDRILLHYFNLIHEAKKFLLLSYTNKPYFQLPDLHSRLSALRIINVDQPDDDIIELLIFKIFANNSVIIDQTIIKYLLKNLPRNFISIINATEMINKYAFENQHKITIPLIKKVLSF